MKKPILLAHEFVSSIPDKLEDAKLYVCLDYTTVAHRCCCGCGGEVITPLSPTDWKLTFDGVSVSLHPSVGNWSFACKSHYWIDRSTVRWAAQWSEQEIATGRSRDRLNKDKYYDGSKSSEAKQPQAAASNPAGKSLWSKLAGWWAAR